MYTKKDIVRYYDLSEIHYRRHWKMEKSRSLHYGYWDNTTNTLHAALLNINRVIARKADIKNTHVAVDAGCGVGGSAIWMAKHIGCRVTGLSLSPRQVSLASQSAERENITELVTFLQKDYTNTGLPDASVDVIWGIESVCYADDKSTFLKEANRILKKGGKLVIVDVFKRQGLTGKDAQLMQELTHGWAINNHSTGEEFNSQLLACGFKNVEVEDATKPIWPSVKRLYLAYYLALLPTTVYRLLHPKATELGKKNVETARLGYTTLKRDLWQYLIFSAEKA